MSDDVRRRLEEAGDRPAPPPDPGFADALEARLRAVAATIPPASTPPLRPRRAATGRWAAAAGLAAVILVVAALGLGLGRADRAVGPGAALAAPVNVEVVLANGTILEDPDGLLLPEGAVVRVGDGGSARIAGVELRAGDVATVGRDGVEVMRPTPVAVLPDPSPDGTRPPATTPATASGSPPIPPTPAPSPSPVPQRTSSPGPTSEATRSPTATGAAATATATARPTPTPTPAIVRPRLRAVLGDGRRIAVRWTATWSAARYVLVAAVSRSGPAADPVYPGSRVLGEFALPPSRAFRVRVPDGVVEVRLMVAALREDGRVLRRSRIVTLTIPALTDPAASDPSSSLAPTAEPASPEAPSPTPVP